MNTLTVPQYIVPKFRDEYLAAVSPIVEQASSISLVQRWDVLFQCSIAPKREWMAPDFLATMLDVYQVLSHDQLMPKYLGNEEHWGAIVSPRIDTASGKPIAYIEHWFVSQSNDLEQVVEAIKKLWPFPFQAIWIAMSPQHRCVPFIQERKNACVKEYVYVADWSHSRPEPTSSTNFHEFTCLPNEPLDSWWRDFTQALNRDGKEWISEREIDSMRKGMQLSLKTGGLLNLYDLHGLAAHISWSKGSEIELLLPECWNITYIFVREDLRGQGLATYMYALASQNMSLVDISLICAHAQAAKPSSCQALESVAAERVLTFYAIG